MQKIFKKKPRPIPPLVSNTGTAEQKANAISLRFASALSLGDHIDSPTESEVGSSMDHLQEILRTAVEMSPVTVSDNALESEMYP